MTTTRRDRATDTHAIELIESLGHTVEGLDHWELHCECGWMVDGPSVRFVTEQHGLHRRMEDDRG